MASFNIAETFGISGINLGANQLTTIALVIFISLVIIGIIGFLIYIYVKRKIYIYTIPVYKLVGNVPTRIAVFKARTINVGQAGDQLMFVAGFKKYLPIPNIQTARNEYWHWIREDGEWINFGLSDLDKEQKIAGVKFIAQDMRMQRLATERLLEQRLMMKSFWEKWGTTIMTVIFFLVIAISLTIFMYMFGKVVNDIGTVTANLKIITDGMAEGALDTGQLIPVN